MDASFWHQKWDKKEIAFHEGDTNLLLMAHVDKLKLLTGSRIFIPLCGKTRDIAWLLSCDYKIVGAELSEVAIQELFAELGVEPEVTKEGAFTVYRALDIDIFVGDIFNVTADVLGHVDAVYDRAALVALNESLRSRYAEHLIEVTHSAAQLLITYEYDQTVIPGPPFSVNETLVHQYYDPMYELTFVERQDIEGGLKGKVASTETVWLLQKRVG